ncbi:hemoglobin subunit beta-4-like [Esox lucius]|uniref:Globin domain-containing protein n=1 Tax=Esox lucius TaxID=8010 RepID=A0AAY5KEL5_ESOLU|nr:hemoglobin subunit beta-4-like [Esox lucius]
MVEWTADERHALASLWGKIDTDETGTQAMARLLIVFPWTRRYFSSLGNLVDSAAILDNPEVVMYGITLMRVLGMAVQNPDNMKNTLTALSVLLSGKLHVDPDNFKLLAECITVCIAAKLGPRVFDAYTHEAFYKFMCVVVSAFKKQYH